MNWIQVNTKKNLIPKQNKFQVNFFFKVKSPSLTDEHFLGINGNTDQISKKTEEFSSVKNSKTKLAFQDTSNQDNVNTFDEDDDEAFDKSATLKANNNLPISLTYSPKENSNNKAMNRNSSEKSIYYSSVIIFLF